MTEFSGGYGKKFDGNSILLQLNDNRYAIGCYIYEFTSNKIISFISPVGNNDFPYPFALDKDNAYLMLDEKYIPLKYLSNIERRYD